MLSILSLSIGLKTLAFQKIVNTIVLWGMLEISWVKPCSPLINLVCYLADRLAFKSTVGFKNLFKREAAKTLYDERHGPPVT